MIWSNKYGKVEVTYGRLCDELTDTKNENKHWGPIIYCWAFLIQIYLIQNIP